MAPAEDEAVELYRRSIETFNRDGTDAWLETCTDDIRVKTVEEFPGGGTFEGKEAVRGLMDEFTEAWDLARFHTGEEHLVNGRIVARSSWMVRGRTSGADTTLEFFAVAGFRNELVSSMTMHWTEDEALEFARGEAN